jgi:limonene 1,2-monooxygenase
MGLLSIAATQGAGFNALASTWALAEDAAKDSGATVDRANWRVVGPMHIAETREQARAEVRHGIEEHVRYFSEVAALPIVPEGIDPVDAFVESGYAVIGTPEDAIAQISRLLDQSGGFGTYLLFDHNWAPWAEKKRSHEMIARYVRPHFQSSNTMRRESWDWAKSQRESLIEQFQAGIAARTAAHMMEKGEANLNPELVSAIKSHPG